MKRDNSYMKTEEFRRKLRGNHWSRKGIKNTWSKRGPNKKLSETKKKQVANGTWKNPVPKGSKRSCPWMRGKNNPQYKHGHRILYRKLVDIVECEKCGGKKYLVVHHIDHSRENNKIENLQVLCQSCHQKHHKKQRR